MSGWKYNLIDLYVSNKPNQLGETAINSEWEQISLYGLMRGRPTLTPSTNNATKDQIPGRPGELYSTVTKRSNAKLQFEILVADAWPFESLKRSDNEWLNNVYNRSFYILDILNNAKRVSYKEPGKTAYDYFEVVSITNEISDADKRAAVIKCTMEIFPFKFSFSGNAGVSLSPYASLNYNPMNLRPFSECWPVFVSNTITGTNDHINIEITCYDRVLSNEQWTYVQKTHGEVMVPTAKRAAFSTALNNKQAIIDTNRLQAYDSDINPINRYLTGEYDTLRIPGNSYVSIDNLSSVTITMYTRRGIAI